MIHYPKNLLSFINTSNKNQTFFNIYKKLGSPRPFDVSLRDGLQGLNKNQQEIFTFDTKKNYFHQIMENNYPSSMEIGSITSNKVLPIFKDSKDLFQYASGYSSTQKEIDNTSYFLLIPNKEKLNELLLETNTNTNTNYTNFSFITSVSNSFQMKNTKKTINEMNNEITAMLQILDNRLTNNKLDYKVKLYISCINECPIEGRINNNDIINEILKYNSVKISNICLSDTMGTLTPDDFEYIVDTCNKKGILFSKFSLHLHVNPSRESIAEQIFNKAFDRNITQFDVSDLETGGCSVTMDVNKLKPNLSYALYYEFLTKYIMTKINN